MPQEQGNGARLSHQIGNRNSVFSTGKKTLHLTQAHGFQAGFSRCPELVGGPEGATQVLFDPTAIVTLSILSARKDFLQNISFNINSILLLINVKY